MKKKLFTFAILLLTFLSFSCEKEILDEGVVPIIAISPEEMPPPFEVVFDDTHHIFTNVEAFVNPNTVSINAQENQIGTFLISVQSRLEEREYTSDELEILYVSSAGDIYSTITGINAKSRLAITLIDYNRKRVSGTFSFVGAKLVNGSPTQETKDFSDGKFYNITGFGIPMNP